MRTGTVRVHGLLNPGIRSWTGTLLLSQSHDPLSHVKSRTFEKLLKQVGNVEVLSGVRPHLLEHVLQVAQTFLHFVVGAGDAVVVLMSNEELADVTVQFDAPVVDPVVPGLKLTTLLVNGGIGHGGLRPLKEILRVESGL